jgi:hypothetical protein
MTMQYVKCEKVSLKNYFDEKWLQDKIEEDPGLLGLGEITILMRERRQLSGGRIDFLLNETETDTWYEVEIQLGATDESHIIRTIEYWDLERKRYPLKDHIAVIVAEDITSRFFNVISLINKSVPIIAIQLNVLKVDGKLCLNFTKVLDTSEEHEDEDFAAEAADRPYWEKRSNPKSIVLMDDLIALTQCDEQRITYNKTHVALGTSRRNFAWFHPRKTEGYCLFNIKVGKEFIDAFRESLGKEGISFTLHKEDELGIPLQTNVFKNNKELIAKLFQDTVALYK